MPFNLQILRLTVTDMCMVMMARTYPIKAFFPNNFSVDGEVCNDLLWNMFFSKTIVSLTVTQLWIIRFPITILQMLRLTVTLLKMVILGYLPVEDVVEND